MEPGPADQSGESDTAADLAVFVDRLAAAGSQPSTAAARTQIRRAIDAGCPPPGVRRLAEALAATVDRAPTPRRTSEDAESVVAALRGHTLVVLEEMEAAELAEVVGELLADGRRVLVTGPDQDLADQVRGRLDDDTIGRVLDELPTLPPGELRELRGLLATSTPARRARSGQDLPAPADLPDPAQVTELCRRGGRVPAPDPDAGLVHGLLAGLDPARRAAVTSVAHLVDRSLTALPATAEWAWRLLSDLVLAQHRAAFDRVLEDTAQAVAAVDRGRDAPRVELSRRPAENALAVLRQYRDFLSGGGRCRTYFRSSLQREAQPMLAGVRVAGRMPTTRDEVSRVIEHLELGEWLRRVWADCAELGVPVPHNDEELRGQHDLLLRVAAAARSVGALRHDVLFLAADSPLRVPDVDTAATVAAAVLEFERNGSAAEAARRLDLMADRLAASGPAATMAPEHQRACAALRARDAEGYQAAVEALVAARREQRDERRRGALLQRLGSVVPELAVAWTSLAERDAGGLGLAVFRPMDELLTELPPADSTDVVLVLGAAALGVEHLLLCAAAPRLIAAIGPGQRPGPAPTLLSVLERAEAMVINGKLAAAPAPVLRIPVLKSAPPRPRPAAVGQAGA